MREHCNLLGKRQREKRQDGNTLDVVEWIFYMLQTALFLGKQQHILAKRAFARVQALSEKLEKSTEPLEGLQDMLGFSDNGLTATWRYQAYLMYKKQMEQLNI